MSALRAVLFGTGALLVAAVAAAETATIIQQGRAFDRPEIAIAVGEVLHFENQDEFIHHIYVKSDTFNFESDEQEPGNTINVKFPIAGTFDVGCQIHPKMHLTVTVK